MNQSKLSPEEEFDFGRYSTLCYYASSWKFTKEDLESFWSSD